MARHVGIDIGVSINDSPLDKLDERLDRTKANARELNDVLGRTKVSDSASNGFSKMSEASGRAGRSVKDLNHALGDTKVSDSAANGFGKITDASERSNRSVKDLNDSLKSTGSDSSGLNRAQGDLNKVTEQANKATSSTNKLRQSVAHAGDESKAVGDLSGTFSRTSAGAEKARTSIDRTSASSGRLKSGWDKLKSAGSAVAQVGSSIATAMVPVAAAFMKANGEAIKLANEYNVIKNLQQTGGDSPTVARRNTKRIERANRRLSLRYGIDQNELAAGTEELIRRGYSGPQDIAAHKYFVQAARASGETYNQVVAAGAPMLEQFGYRSRAGNSVKRMSKYTRDVLNKAAYIADLTSGNIGGANGFGESFKMMGSAAHSNGQSIDTMLGALGTLSNYGEKGSSAGTGMRQIITRLIKAPGSKTMSAALRDMHVNPNNLFTRNGHLKQLGSIFEILNHSARGMKSNRVSADLQTLFGQTGFNDAQILMGHYQNLQHNARESKSAAKTGYIQSLSAKNMTSLKNRIAQTKQLANQMGMSFSKQVAPGISKALGYANKLLNAFLGMPKPLKQATAYITAGLGVLGGSKLASGFLKANFGIGNGKGLGGIAGTLLFGAKGKKGTPRTGGLVGLMRRTSNGQLFANAKEGTLRHGINRMLESQHAAGGFGKLSTAGKIATGAAYGGTAISAGTDLFKAFQDRHSATKRSKDIGSGIGAAVGGGLATAFLGPEMAPVGIALGKTMGKFGGEAVNKFTKGWQSKKPPKNKFSMANLGWSAHNAARQANDWFNKNINRPIGKNLSNFGKSWNSFWGARGNNMKQFGHGISSTFGKMGNGIKHAWQGMGSWIGKTSSSIGRNVQRGWNGTVKFFKDLPGNIHKGWNRAMLAGHKFFKSLPKNMSNMGKTMQKDWNGTINKIHGKLSAFGKWYRGVWSNIFKAINNNRYVKAFKRGQLFQTAFHDMRSRWNSFNKWFGGNWRSFWNKTHKWAVASWNGTKRNWNGFWTAMPKRWNSFKTSFGKGWNSFWSGIGRWFNKTVKGIKKAWNDTIGNIAKGISKIQGFFGGIGKWFGQAKGRLDKTRSENAKAQAYANAKTANNQRAFMNDIAFFFGHSHHTFKYEKVPKAPAHAKGTASLVGEAGPELAYRPWANSARILGANGPQLARVHSGEKILNARDTAKVMAGGLGKGLVLKGYASGTAKLGKATKSVTNDYKKISKSASDSLSKLTKTNKSSWTKIGRNASGTTGKLVKTNKSSWGKIRTAGTNAVKSLQNHNSATWRRIASQTNRYTDKTRTSTVKDYMTMQKSVGKQMDNMHDSVISTANSTSKGFGKAMEKTRSYAKDAMVDTIGQLNKGINGIDKVISEFGGSGSAIKPVHFATGSNGELTSNTIAMVNDANYGPRQESIVRGGNLIVPHGKDRIFALQKGDRVLNGRQTLGMAHSMGLPHFAKGSGVGHGQLKHLYDIAKQNWKDPDKTGKAQFGKVTGLRAGAKVLADNAFKTGQQEGLKYWSTMWSMAKSKVEDDGSDLGPATGLLKEVEHLGRGHRYVLGTWGPDTYDCSGLVSRAIQDMFHKGWGRMNVAGLWTHASKISKAEAKPGDPVFWLPNHHVGIYIGGDKYWSAFSPNAHPDIGVHPISSSVPGVRPTYGRFRGISNPSSSSHKQEKVKTNSAYERFVKNSVGNGFWAMMRKIGNTFGEGLGSLSSFAMGDSLKKRARALAGGLKQLDPRATRNGIAAVLGNWEFESGGLNPGITNNGNAAGLGQWLGARKANLMAYARRHHKSWKDPAVQLSFAVKGDTGNTGILRSVLEGHGSIASLANKFSAEWERGGYNAQHVHGAMIIRNALGFAKGGNAKAHVPYIAGEKGPELITANGTTHIDTNDETKSKLGDLFEKITIKKPKPIKVHRPQSKPPVININLNGPISSTEDAHRVANIVRVEVAKVLENIGDEFGTDPTVY